MPILASAHERRRDQVQFVGVKTVDAPCWQPISSKSSMSRTRSSPRPTTPCSINSAAAGCPATLLGSDGALLGSYVVGPLEAAELEQLLRHQ